MISECLPRDKHVALGATGVSSVTFLQDCDCSLHVEVGEIYPKVGGVNRPPLAPLHGEVNFIHHPWEQYPACLCLLCRSGVVGVGYVPTEPMHLLPVVLQ